MLQTQTSTCHKALRLLNASLATIYSVCGFMEFIHFLSLLANLFTHDGGTQYILSYMIIRLIMAIVQTPAHANVLFAMRYTTEFADKVTKVLGGGDLNEGIEKYYGYVDKCNYGLSVFIILSIISLSLQSHIKDVTFYILEVTSLTILTGMLLARFYGWLSGKTREMFYLPWSNRMST